MAFSRELAAKICSSTALAGVDPAVSAGLAPQPASVPANRAVRPNATSERRDIARAGVLSVFSIFAVLLQPSQFVPVPKWNKWDIHVSATPIGPGHERRGAAGPPPFESIILYSFENNTLLRIMY